MSEKHKLAPVYQKPVAWARMKYGKITSVFHDKGVAEFVAGFAASELVPLYVYQQPADAAQTARWLGWNADQKDLIREVFMRNGFTVKAGKDDLADYVYAAAYELLQTAPAVQGESVGWQFYQDGRWWNGDDRIKDLRKNTEAAGIPVRGVYTAPRPAGQQPATDAPDLVEALRQYRHNDGSGLVFGYDSETTQRVVAQLVEALKASTHRLHEQAEGEDDCRCSQCRFVRLRDAALAAYRNQGGKP